MRFFTPEDREVLVNRTEEPVLAAVEQFLAGPGAACTCRDCRLDIAAIALNRLPPRYAVSDEHAVHHGRTVASPSPLEIEAAVQAAAVIVARSPHHD